MFSIIVAVLFVIKIYSNSVHSLPKCNLLLYPTTKHDFENFERTNCLFAPQVVGLPTINNTACKLQKLIPVQRLYHVYARFRIFVVFKDFEHFGRANCPFARLPICPPGCGPAYHQLNNISCKLQKLVPVQKLYRVYARFVTSKAQGGNPPANFFPLKNVLDIVKA